MLRFSYDIDVLPEETWGYNVIAFTEGKLRVEMHEGEFLDADGVLLAELAVVLYKWFLKRQSGGGLDLYYASMDFEEEPILAATYDSNSHLMTLGSVWAATGSIRVSVTELERASWQYISELGLELRERIRVDLTAILARAAADDEAPVL